METTVGQEAHSQRADDALASAATLYEDYVTLARLGQNVQELSLLTQTFYSPKPMLPVLLIGSPSRSV